MITCDKTEFINRLKGLYSPRNDAEENWFDVVDYIFCINSKDDDRYMEGSKALMFWLLECNLLGITMIFGKKTLYFISNNMNIKSLKALLDRRALIKIKEIVGIDIQFMEILDEWNNSDKAQFEPILNSMAKNMLKKKIGLIEYNNNDLPEFNKVFSQYFRKNDWTIVNMSHFAADLMSVRKNRDLKYMKRACRMTHLLYSECFGIFNEIDIGIFCKKAPTNRDVVTEICRILKEGNIDPNKNSDDVTTCYLPIVQSGGIYDLKINNNCPGDNKWTPDVIVLSIGLKYRHFCSSFVRTVIVEPKKHPDVLANYVFLIEVQNVVITSLCDGVKLSQVYETGMEYVKHKRPDLVDNLTDNFGSVIGIKVEEKCYEINQNNSAIARKNMTFTVTVGFNFIVDQSKTVMKSPPYTYSLWIGDVVKVEKDKPATVLIPLCKMEAGIYD